MEACVCQQQMSKEQHELLLRQTSTPAVTTTTPAAAAAAAATTTTTIATQQFNDQKTPQRQIEFEMNHSSVAMPPPLVGDLFDGPDFVQQQCNDDQQQLWQQQQQQQQQQMSMKKRQMQLPLTAAAAATSQPSAVPAPATLSSTTATHLAKINWWNSPPQPWQFNNFTKPTKAATPSASVTPTIKKSKSPAPGSTPKLTTPTSKQTTPTLTPTTIKPQKQQHHQQALLRNHHHYQQQRLNYEQQQQHEQMYDADDGEQYSQHSQLIAATDRSQPNATLHGKAAAGMPSSAAAAASTVATTAVLNANDDNEMQVTGYRRSLMRTILCWLCICLTIGILRLVLHWWRHWYLIATHTPCSLDTAEMVLIEENYQGKHKLFYVKPVQVITIADLVNSMRQDNCQLPAATTAVATTTTTASNRAQQQIDNNKANNFVTTKTTTAAAAAAEKLNDTPNANANAVAVAVPAAAANCDKMRNFHKIKLDNHDVDVNDYADDDGDEDDDDLDNFNDVIDGVNVKDLYLTMHFSSAQFKTSKSVRLFNCKQLRYAWNVETQQFEKLNGLDMDIDSFYYHQQQPLPETEQYSRRLIYGSNEITVPYKDIKTLLFLEVLNPFYVFQIFSVILWFTYDYYYYACVIVLMSVFGVSMSVIQTKKNQDALRATVQNTGQALVLNSSGKVIEVATQRLVPGDIIEIPTNGCIMQCDAILLSGNCILDESMLTGESVPVTKTPLPKKRNVTYDKKTHSRHTLFCGTKVIQTRYFGSEKVLAIVTNTGNITAKGGLVRSILYPPPVDYKFEQDSYKFIECLALIAFIGFIYTLVSKIMRNVDPVKIAIESLDLITIVVPPALPAAMTVGRFYAQKRLKRQSIYCISPRSINVAGSINCCCFDKTGTLTEDGLDMWGVVPKSVTNEFQIPMRDIQRLPADNFLFGMVTCHSITVMNGKRMGDPLDLKMFESTGWILEDVTDIADSQKYGLLHPTIVRQPKHLRQPTGDADGASGALGREQRQSSVDDLLSDVGLLDGETQNDHGIVREFPFTSNLQRMSVITRRLCEKNFNVYCKGSPEMLQQLCQPATLPANYTHQLAMYAKQGYRVIAMAYKPLSRKINFTKVHRLTREAIEMDLEFLGFVIMENRLKPDTTKVIHSLNTANIRTIMVTGDNILTALSVARDCGIVSETQAVVTVHVRKEFDKYKLYYTLESGSDEYATGAGGGGGGGGGGGDDVDSVIALNGGYSKMQTPCGNGNLPSFNSTLRSESSYAEGGGIGGGGGDTTVMTELPLSGSLCTLGTTTFEDFERDHDVENGKRPAAERAGGVAGWRQNYRFAMVGDTWQVVREHFPDELNYFITRGAIFARMSPEAKQSLVMELQAIDYCVAMCGDGANDCGALKVAHTGISLSETESSIASPFTSCNPTIACVPNVIREGRAALVTSFGIFKYMAAYSMVQFISVMILYSIDTNLTDKQYLYIDLGLISVFAFFFGKTAAYDGPLHKRVPLSSLISLMPLGSLLLHLFVVVVFQVSGWFQLHAQYPTYVLTDEEHLGCYENYTIFAISSFQYIILAIVFSKGAPYRKSLRSNLPFCLSIVLNLAFVVYLIVYPPVWLANFFQLVVPPTMDFRYWMVAYGVVAFIVHIALEELFVELVLFKVTNRRETYAQKFTHIEAEMRMFHQWPSLEVLPYGGGAVGAGNAKSGNNTMPGSPTALPPYGSADVGKATVAATSPDEGIALRHNAAGNAAAAAGVDEGSEFQQFVRTPHYVELSVQQNFDVTTPTPTGLNSFFT